MLQSLQKVKHLEQLEQHLFIKHHKPLTNRTS